MKDHLKSLVAEHPDPMSIKNTAREYLQARILQSLQEQGAFTQWAFLGGTALRFLFRLPRYSEDQDFPGAGNLYCGHKDKNQRSGSICIRKISGPAL